MEFLEKPKPDPLPKGLLIPRSGMWKHEENLQQELEHMLEYCEEAETVSTYTEEFRAQKSLSLIYLSNKLEGTLPSGVGCREVYSLLYKIMNHYDDKYHVSHWKVSGDKDPVMTESQLYQHFRAYRYLCSSERLSSPLTVEDVKETYKILMTGAIDNQGKDIPLEDYRLGPRIDNDYVYPPEICIPFEMKEIVQCFNDSSDHFILRAAKLFFQTINLQPFPQANNRLCHLLLAFALMKGNCSYPVSIIPGYEDKREYRDYQTALYQVRGFADYSLLVQLILKACFYSKRNYESNIRIMRK